LSKKKKRRKASAEILTGIGALLSGLGALITAIAVLLKE